MIDWLKQVLGGTGTSRKLSLVAAADHVELSATHLVIGLQIDWHNQTSVPIPIKEIQITVHLKGRDKKPLRFYPLERFSRSLTHRAIQKAPIRPFSLPPNQIYTEQIRFISEEILDIPPGNYAVDVEMKDTDDAGYTNRTKIELGQKIKYRRSEEWQGEEN